MPKRPTSADADLILKLYDLRREAEIRKARNWWLIDFWPDNAADVMKVAQAMGTQEKQLAPAGGGLLGVGRVAGGPRHRE